MTSTRQIENNVRVHGRVADAYARTHGEIYNDVEQARLREALRRALAHVRSTTGTRRALDFGCGAGNLTDHLIDLGAETVSADVTPEFLAQVRNRHGQGSRSTTAQLNGQDLRQFETSTFDIVATYSVLHHVPDYLGAVREMARVVKPGGVLFIDHEPVHGELAAAPNVRTAPHQPPEAQLVLAARPTSRESALPA
jgi:2-polyprenyl-3-methyl-5-hydroxy-6-metoxy-1,4-benzoquinol methylase